MMIKILLLVLLLLLAIFVLTQKTASRGVRLIVSAVLVCGAYLVWLPERANALAQVLGVGRGADLLLYLWVVITFSVILLLYLKIVETDRMMTALARQVALNQPMLPVARKDVARKD